MQASAFGERCMIWSRKAIADPNTDTLMVVARAVMSPISTTPARKRKPSVAGVGGTAGSRGGSAPKVAATVEIALSTEISPTMVTSIGPSVSERVNTALMSSRRAKLRSTGLTLAHRGSPL